MEVLFVLLKLIHLLVRACLSQAFEFYVSTVAQNTSRLGKHAADEGDAPSPPLALCVENMTASWLSDLLREKGWIEKGDAIQTYTLEPFGEIGQMSTMFRLTARTTLHSSTILSLIVKSNEKTIKGRVTSALTYGNEIEVGFYRDLSGTDDAQQLLPHPNAVFQALDAATGNSLIIMEEVGNVQKRELGDNFTLEQSRAYLGQLAKMHAHFWNSPKLLDFDWLKNNTIKREETWGGMMKILWNSKGKARVEEAMTAQEVSTIETFVQHSNAYCHRLDSRNYTLCHGDTNLFNLLTKTGSNETLTVDWQTILRGNWSQDVAYFFLSNLDAKMREKHEVCLLEHYRAELHKYGVSISQEELAEDFVFGNIFNLVYFVMSSGVLEPDNPKEEEIWKFFLSRVSYILQKYCLAEVVASLQPAALARA